MEENKLALILNESGLEESKSQVLLRNFSNYFEIAAEWERKADALKVDNPSQVVEMKMSGEGRRYLKGLRVNIEKTRKLLKESSLRESQTIDSIARILTNLITPIENQLEQSEKFLEIQASIEAQKIFEQRRLDLEPYAEYVPYGIDLRNMTKDDYEKVLSGAKLLKKQAEDDAKRQEEERIEREKAEALEREKMRLENERLKKEAAERQKRLDAERKVMEDNAKKERDRLDAERRIMEEKLAKERQQAEAERKKLEKQLEQERQAAEKERKERERLAAIEKKKEQEEQRRQAEMIMAPDVKKFLRLAAELDKMTDGVTNLNTERSEKILANVKILLAKVSLYIRNKIDMIDEAEN